jgi:hypothetical protein
VYTLKLAVDGKAYTQTVTVKNDPRSPATAADLRAQHALQMKLVDGIKEAWDAYNQVAAMRAAVADLSRSNPPADVAAASTAFEAKLAAMGGTTGGGRRGAGGGGGGGGFGAGRGAAAPPNFVGINGALIRQLDTLDFGDMAPNEPMNKAYAAGCGELKTAVLNWKTINGQDLTAFNAILTKNNLKPVASAPTALPIPVCSPAPAMAPTAGGRGRQ